MGRPREFDLDQTLDRAMRLFWKKGFDGVSLQELLGELGINNSSFYHAFGSKEALFDQVLEHYFTRVGAYRVAPLLEDRPARDSLLAYFDRLIELNCASENPAGCLVANSVVMAGSASAEVTRKIEATVRRTKARLEAAFFRVLERGHARGEIRAEIDPPKYARLLVALVFGANLSARLGRNRRELEDIRDSLVRSCCVDENPKPKSKK